MKRINTIDKTSPLWKYYESKMQIHELSNVIKSTKKQFKISQASGNPDYMTMYKLIDGIKAYRILHIARSMFRGVDYEKIERPRNGNELKASDWTRIHVLIDYLRKKQIADNI